MNAGYVYILRNPSMPGLLKIGQTRRDVKERAAELSSNTGVPTPFEVVHFVFVANAAAAEADLHRRFSNLRQESNREFFRLVLSDAIRALEDIEKKYFAETDSGLGDDVDENDRAQERFVCVISADNVLARVCATILRLEEINIRLEEINRKNKNAQCKVIMHFPAKNPEVIVDAFNGIFDRISHSHGTIFRVAGSPDHVYEVVRELRHKHYSRMNDINHRLHENNYDWSDL